MSADHSTHRDGAVVVATKRKLEDFAREVNALAEKHDIPFPEQMTQNMKKALLPLTLRRMTKAIEPKMEPEAPAKPKVYRSSVALVADEQLGAYTYTRLPLAYVIKKIEDADDLPRDTLLLDKGCVHKIRQILATLQQSNELQEDDLNPAECEQLQTFRLIMQDQRKAHDKKVAECDQANLLYGPNSETKEGYVPFMRPNPAEAAQKLQAPITWSKYAEEFIKNAEAKKAEFNAAQNVKSEKPTAIKTANEQQKNAAQRLGFFGTEQWLQVQPFTLMLQHHFHENKADDLKKHNVTEQQRRQIIEICTEAFAMYRRAWNKEHDVKDNLLKREDDMLAAATKQPALARIPRLSDRNLGGTACTPKQ